MPGSIRTLTAAAAASAAVALSLAASQAAIAASTDGPQSLAQAPPAAAGAGAGLTGKPITLANNEEFSGYDAATSKSGTAYVGWIGNANSAGRKVYLCTLPRGATRCAGGVQSVDSLGTSSAFGLRVLITQGQVTLVWFHDTVASENGPQGSEIATATATAAGHLSASHDVATAPSFGLMQDAEVGPGGAIWVVTQVEQGAVHKLQIRPGFASAPVTISTPYFVGSARLAFSGTTAVLAVDKDGAISDPVSFASKKAGGAWSAFRKVAHTWTADANFGLTSTPHGIRLLATVDNATYRPVVSRWTGSGFSRPSLTGDTNNCSPSSHDPVGDPSGRLADVSMECSDVAIANLPSTQRAAVIRFNVHGTFAGGNPQLTTAPSGRGWVAWSIESSVSNKLLVAPVLLPGRDVTVRKSAGGDRVTLTGPASCLPPVSVHVGVTGSPAGRVTGKTLKLGGTTLHSGTLRGGSLTPGKSYTLTGRVTFAGGSRRTVAATLKFRTCPKP
jgi:hypothetical protein